MVSYLVCTIQEGLLGEVVGCNHRNTPFMMGNEIRKWFYDHGYTADVRKNACSKGSSTQKWQLEHAVRATRNITIKYR
jgi:hypothetical protein